LVAVSIEESSIIMVVNEDPESIDIFEVVGLILVLGSDLVHALSTLPDVSDCVEHWIIEETCYIVLVGSNIGCISIEVFSHLENSSCCTILRPEIFGDLRDCVNSDTIKSISLNDSLNPILKILSYVRISILIKIGEISKSAVFNLSLIVPVRNLAVRVVVFSLVQRVYL